MSVQLSMHTDNKLMWLSLPSIFVMCGMLRRIGRPEKGRRNSTGTSVMRQRRSRQSEKHPRAVKAKKGVGGGETWTDFSEIVRSEPCA